jgi:hypothetical protein
MAKTKWHTEWKVLSHHPPRQLEDNLMVADAPVPGMPLERRMTVIRLRDGRLVIHSAIALEDEAMGRLEAWGTPAFLVVPNHYHRLDALSYKQRYPALAVIADAKGRQKIERALPVDGGLELLPAGLELHGEALDGCKVGEMAFIVTHGAGKTLLLNDAMFNTPHQRGFGGLVMRLLGSTGPLKVSRIMRWFGVADTRAFIAHLRRLADTEGLTRLVMSHGVILEGDDVASRMRRALG